MEVAISKTIKFRLKEKVETREHARYDQTRSVDWFKCFARLT